MSSDYSAIDALSIRQAFSAIEITISKDESGGYDAGDILVFMKGVVFKRCLRDVGFSVWTNY